MAANPARLMNVNSGAGTQSNYYTGGPNNRQFNADNLHYYASLERAETPSLPTSNLPFTRDPNFVDRPELDRLEQRLVNARPRVALTGLGGIGKSQLAIECCYRLRQRSPGTWVLWVHARSPARFEESLRKLANDVKISGRNDPKANILYLVRGWLSNAARRWLLVIDNADDPEVLLRPYDSLTNVSGAIKVPMDCVPICEHGSIIITTRNDQVAAKLVDACDIIVIEPCCKEKIGCKTEGQDDVVAMEILVEQLECVPLAISQAAAYIGKAWPRCSVAQYTARLDGSRSANLLNIPYTELRRDPEAENSIFQTWQVSFEHLRRTKRSAADLLSLMSFYDYQGIPELLLHTIEQGSLARDIQLHDDSCVVPITTFNDDIDVLLQFHLISVAPDGRSFEMHRLVQLSARYWLEAHGQDHRWAERSLQILDTAWPWDPYDNWQQCQMLFPHAKVFADHKPEGSEAVRPWGSIMTKAGFYLLARGMLRDAETFAHRFRTLKRGVLPDNDPLALRNEILLAHVLRESQRYGEAEEILQRVLKDREETLGKEHPETFDTLHILAFLFIDKGDHTTAVKIFRQVIEGLESSLGRDDPRTLRSLQGFGFALLEERSYDEAELIFRQVAGRCEKVLGREHPYTLISLSGLADTLERRGEYAAAERIYRETLILQGNLLGIEHPSTLYSLNSLSDSLYQKGDYAAAEKLYGQVVEGREKVLGKEHPDTLCSLHNLSHSVYEQGNYAAAEKLDREVVERREKILGKEHPDTLCSLHNLSHSVYEQGNYAAAEKLDREVVERRQKVLGREHHETIKTRADLADTLRGLGEYDKSRSMIISCAEISRRVLGPDHADTVKWTDCAEAWAWEDAERSIPRRTKQATGINRITSTSTGPISKFKLLGQRLLRHKTP